MNDQLTSPSRLATLLAFTRPHRRTIGLGLVLALLTSATGLASPLVTRAVLDALDTSGSLRVPVLILAGLLIVGSVISLWQWILLGTLAERIVLEARGDLVRRFLGARLGAILRQPTGELVTRVTSDTLLLREAASSSMVGLINGSIMLVGSLILMGVLDLWLLLVTMVAVAIVVALFATLMPGIATAREQAQESIGRMGGSLEGALRAIRTVKASRAETRLAGVILEQADASAQASIRALRREALAWVIAWSGVQLAIIAILGFGAWRVSEGELGVSSLIAFLLYAFGLMGPIMEISQNMTTVQSGLAAAGRIESARAIDQEHETTVRPSPMPEVVTPSVTAVSFHNVTLRYAPDAEPAVRSVSLEVPATGHLAIVGPSGAGKTSLFSLMLRFVEPDAGHLAVAGRDYDAQSYEEVRRHFAYVEQESPIVPGSVRDNIAFTWPDASDDEIWSALREVNLDARIADLPDGIDTVLDSGTLSGGQRQRIAVARAIMRSPDVLLLDEATAQVDGITEAAIQRVIRDRSRTSAVITIAHRLSTVVFADRIVVMEDGVIRDQGTHRELLDRDELYRDLVEALRIADQRQEADSETIVVPV